ncbi:hypothetical protein G5I_04133 [Acromyrmex echinatior]|uniref:Uncharacterized protein n=1 Tax=Acromyrmex echinatior TaxID=103372 RepID=F4WET5_ACREC|nr:hypothetical protein G5I_04133 [Acromyrmex echinatior]
MYLVLCHSFGIRDLSAEQSEYAEGRIIARDSALSERAATAAIWTEIEAKAMIGMGMKPKMVRKMATKKRILPTVKRGDALPFLSIFGYSDANSEPLTARDQRQRPGATGSNTSTNPCLCDLVFPCLLLKSPLAFTSLRSHEVQSRVKRIKFLDPKVGPMFALSSGTGVIASLRTLTHIPEKSPIALIKKLIGYLIKKN